jgi:acyl transferase domain-containing protein
MTVQPDYLLGYSLGETAAAIVSGALSLEEALEFSVAQARLLEERTAPAGMLAILEKEAIVHELHPLFRRVIVTGRNFDGNFVVTGEEAEIAELERSLESLHVATVRLAVNYGFHTAMIEPIKSEFIRLARTLSYGRVEIPTISAFSGSEVESVSAEYLWDVMRHPVDFHRAVTVMLNRGDYVFLDVGPSGSLATLVKHALPRGSASSAVSAINQYGRNLQTLSKLQTALSGAAMFVA